MNRIFSNFVSEYEAWVNQYDRDGGSRLCGDTVPHLVQKSEDRSQVMVLVFWNDGGVILLHFQSNSGQQ